MKFSDLQEAEKIQAVKDQFVSIVEMIHADNNKLKQYIKLDQPKLPPIVLELDNGDPAIIARNELATTAANIANEKLLADYNSKKNAYDAILKKISSFKKKEDCQCGPPYTTLGPCLDVNLTSGVINSELELLIDAARLEAQNKSY
jgi:hypothetical protein